MSLSTLDIILLIVLLVTLVLGLIKGLVRQAIGLVGGRRRSRPGRPVLSASRGLRA